MAETLVYTSEKTLKDNGDKIKPELKKEIEDKIQELNKVKNNDNIEEIKAKTSDLSQAIQKAGTEMYKQSKEPDDKKK